MACFIVPAVEAAVVSTAAKIAERKEEKKLTAKAGTAEFEAGEGMIAETAEKAQSPAVHRISLRKVKWLTNLLWGGSAILAFEHLWHGEIVPYFPFLTAMYRAEDTAAMLREMSTVGTAMAVLITAVWVCMVRADSMLEKRRKLLQETEN